jgi:hypothetical protein
VQIIAIIEVGIALLPYMAMEICALIIAIIGLIIAIMWS